MSLKITKISRNFYFCGEFKKGEFIFMIDFNITLWGMVQLSKRKFIEHFRLIPIHLNFMLDFVIGYLYQSWML
jgi:hypothetical protein